MKKNSRKCPYCGSNVSYIKSLTEVSGGEHTCRECGRISNITYDKKIYITAGILLLVALILAAFMFFSDFSKHILLKFIITVIPFGIFFFMIPLYFRLNPIKSEALKPAVKIYKKSDEKQNMKYIKNNSNTVQAEESTDVKNNGSFKDRFHKFVKTYIVVDDDEDESKKIETVKKEKPEPPKKPEKKKEYKDEFGSFDDEVIIEESFNEDTDENIMIENIDIDDEYSQPDNSEIIDIYSSSKKDETDEDDEIFVVEENADTSAFKRPEVPHSDKISAKKEEVKEELPKKEETKVIPAQPILRTSEAVSQKIEDNKDKPVYHKYTKTDKVDFLYYPPCKDCVTYDMMKDPEPEIDEEEQENEDILNFFYQAPSAEEEEEFGKNQVQKIEVTFEKKEEETEPQEEEVYEEEQIEETVELEFEYLPEDTNVISVNIDTDEADGDIIEETPVVTVNETQHEEEISEPSDETDEDVIEEETKVTDSEYSESADEADDDVVAETPNKIFDETPQEEEEFDFDFGDTEDAPENANDDDIISYDEKFEVTGDISDIPVLTQEEINEANFKINNADKNTPVLTKLELKDEDSGNVSGIEFGKEFDEIFDFMPAAKAKESGMKLESISDTVTEDDDIAEESTMKLEDVSDTVVEDEEESIIYTDDEEDAEENAPDEDIAVEEEDDELFDEDDEDDYYEDEEPIEGAVEYVPEDKPLEKTRVFSKVEPENDFVVEYSDDDTDDTENEDDSLFDDDDEEIDFSGYQTSSYTESEDESEYLIGPEEEDDTTNSEEVTKKAEVIVKEEPAPAKPSKYEKKFPKAAQAAAVMAQKKAVQEKTVTEEIEEETPAPKKPVKKKSKAKSKGFFSVLKEKIVEATEEERNAAFEQEEEERRQADKEARRKAKEKAKAEKEKINAENAKKKSKK